MRKAWFCENPFHIMSQTSVSLGALRFRFEVRHHFFSLVFKELSRDSVI